MSVIVLHKWNVTYACSAHSESNNARENTYGRSAVQVQSLREAVRRQKQFKAPREITRLRSEGLLVQLQRVLAQVQVQMWVRRFNPLIQPWTTSELFLVGEVGDLLRRLVKHLVWKNSCLPLSLTDVNHFYHATVTEPLVRDHTHCKKVSCSII